MGDVAFRVLGPVEVIRDGAVVALGQGTLTDLLATLAVSPGRVVATETIIEAVWQANPAAHPKAAMHSAVARLRRMIGGDFIQTLPPGYLLRVQASTLDLLRFEELRAAAGLQPNTESALAALTEAIGLWRGMPLQNVLSSVLLSDAVPRLTELYLRCCEEWAELSLRAGRPDDVISRLAALADAHPFRERIVELLMLALYRDGRQAEALAAYDAVRQPLRDEMGIDPGPALQDLYLKILRADPSLPGIPLQASCQLRPAALPAERDPAGPALSPVTVPRQLPRDMPDFRGRQDELEELARLAAEADSMPGGTPVMAISGRGGIGKTALAVRAAHALSGAFPNGQLFADLHGSGLKRTPAASVLAGFLHALGVTGPALPSSIADRVAMFRSLTAGRRMLIVLDNAASEVQLRPLLPASASCAVIVTSRARMTGLPGARLIHLDVLDEHHAMDLLGTIIGPGRVNAELEDARQLAALCGGLPLALRIAGMRLAAKPHWPLAALAGRLADQRRRLSELAYGDFDVRASFAVSYEALDEAARAMLRRLSLLDAPDFAAWAGAALLDIDPAEAADICERLVDAQLLDPATHRRAGEIRYRFHDLVRVFARGLASDTEPAAARAAALDRAFGAWLALAAQAHRSVYGGEYTVLHGNAPRWTKGGMVPQQAILRDPLDWLEGERLAILAVVRQSAETGRHQASWDLAWTAVTLYEARGYYGDWREAAQHALTAARSAGDLRGTAAMLTCLASLRLQGSQVGPGARELAEEALDLFSQAGDIHGCAMARYRVGMAYSTTGDLDQAIREFEQSRRDSHTAGDTFMEGGVLRELGSAHLRRGEHEAAARCLAESLRLHQQTGSLRGQALTLHTLGELRLRQGDPDAAIGLYQQVLGMVQHASDIVGQAHATMGLGRALASAGQPDQARERLLTALRLGRQVRNYPVENHAQQALDRLARSQTCEVSS